MEYGSQFDYVDVAGVQLYVVRHRPAAAPRASVVIAGPFAPYRPDSYASLARWGRFLAAAGHEVIRFDYRGVGESSGRFEDFTFSDWYADLTTAVGLLGKERSAPLVLHGVGLGGIFAARAFGALRGDALAIWGSPRSARNLMTDALRARLAGDLVHTATATRKTRDDYVAELEAGTSLEVDDYRWTRALWLDSEQWNLEVPATAEGQAERARSWTLTQAHAHLVTATGKGVRADPDKKMRPMTSPAVDALFAETLGWLDEVAARKRDVA